MMLDDLEYSVIYVDREMRALAQEVCYPHSYASTSFPPSQNGPSARTNRTSPSFPEMVMLRSSGLLVGWSVWLYAWKSLHLTSFSSCAGAMLPKPSIFARMCAVRGCNDRSGASPESRPSARRSGASTASRNTNGDIPSSQWAERRTHPHQADQLS